MKRFINVKTILTATGLCSMLFAGTAAAEYRVTAFGYSTEYNALLSGNARTAKTILGEVALIKRDFIEANNLCVAEILARELLAAERACIVALEKVDGDRSIGIVARQSAKASIYSNLAVARAMSGDIAEASNMLETALSFNSRDRNAIANYDLMNEKLPATEIARGF